MQAGFTSGKQEAAPHNHPCTAQKPVPADGVRRQKALQAHHFNDTIFHVLSK
jgi:hypothetical protein